MNYEELKEWIKNKMRPADGSNYQPVMIRKLNQNGGKATKRQIQKELSKENPGKRASHFDKLPFDVLVKHGVVELKDGYYELIAFKMYQEESDKVDEIARLCNEKIGGDVRNELKRLAENGVSERVCNALLWYWKKRGATYKRDQLKNPKRDGFIEEDELLDDDQRLHGMVKGTYKAKGEKFAQAIMLNPESKYKMELERDYQGIRINYDYKDTNQDQVSWMEKSLKENVPIGVVFCIGKNKWRVLGLCTVKEKIGDSFFKLESFGVTKEAALELKEKAILDYDRNHTAEGLTNVPDADWEKIPSGTNSDEFESMIESEKIRLTKSDMTISELVSAIDQGKIAIPKFQRYYVWKPYQVTSLLNSIFQEHFIGNLLVWNVQNKEQKEMCGIMRIEGSQAENLRGDDIVIDGQQRITSLYYAIKGPEKDNKKKYNKKKENHPGFFYINLNNFITDGDEDDTIVGLKKKIPEEETFNKLYFPFFNLETKKRDKWLDGLEDFFKQTTVDKDKLKNYVKIFRNKLTRFWSGYAIPQLELSNVDFDKIATIFQKVNTTGTPLGVFEIMIVKLWANKVDLRELWETTLKQYPKIEFYDEVIKTDKTNMGKYIMESISISYSKSKSCKRKDLLKMLTVEGWSPDDFNKIWEDTSEWMNKAIEKLELTTDDGFGVESAKSIPYEPILPILASLLRELEIKFKSTQIDCYDKIQRWYWVSIFGKRFSDSVDAKKTSDYKDMVEWFEHDDKVPEFITDFKIKFGSIILRREKRGAIYDGMFSILTKKGAQDFEIRVTTNKKPPHKDHIFPQSRLQGIKEKDSILNMTWLTQETNTETKKARMPSEYIKQVMEEKYGNDKTKFLKVLSSHLINGEGLDALLEDDFEEFISLREKEMKKEIAIRTGIKDPNEIELEYGISSEKNYENAIAIRNVLQECKKEFIWCSPYFSIGDQDMIFGIRDHLNVKKIRLLTSVLYGDKRLRSEFKRFKNDMKEYLDIECEMRVSVDILKEQHMRFLVDPYKCWKMVDTTTVKVAKSDLVLELPKGKSEGKKREEVEKWWNNSYDIINDWPKIEPLIEEYEKKQEERKKGTN